MQEFIDACFSGPTLPATILLVVASVYWVFVLVGASCHFMAIYFHV